MGANIVGLCGPARVGKDTVYREIISCVPGLKIAKIAFADPIKKILADLFCLTDEQLNGSQKEVPVGLSAYVLENFNRLPSRHFSHYTKVTDVDFSAMLYNWLRKLQQKTLKGEIFTPRKLMQWLGKYGRKRKESIWVDIALADSAAKLQLNDMVIITDVRFRNEMLAIKQKGGVLVKVTADGNPVIPPEVSQDVSEIEIDSVPDFWYDGTILNDMSSSYEELKTQVRNLCQFLFQLPLNF